MQRPRATVAPLAVGALIATLSLSGVAGADPGYQYHVVGNPGDVTTPTTGGLLLEGGGLDVDAAFEWMIDRSGGGDFVVIRATGTDAYNPYIFGLGTVDSVATLIIKTSKGANNPFVLETIRNAEALFIAGGDQADYVNLWKGSPVEDAIHAVAAKGAPIGGTSAGLAIMGEYSFAALRGTVVSSDALANPFNRYMTLERDFLSLSHMNGTITDSHFVERDRMGRTLAFLARILRDGWAGEARGIAIDTQTALAVEPSGETSLIAGKPTSAVYFLRTPGPPEICEPSTPLTFRNISVYRIAPGGTFDLQRWTGRRGAAYTLSVEAGAIQSSQPGGLVY